MPRFLLPFRGCQDARFCVPMTRPMKSFIISLKNMELFATGFNAWNQLCFHHGQDGSHDDSELEDIRSFTSVLTDERIDRVEPFLSYTRVLSTPSGLRSAGFLPRSHEALRTTSELDEFNLFAEASNGVVHLLLENGHESNSNSSWSFSLPSDGEHGPATEITQLVSYETGFAALPSTGTVFTWGDERYSACLGREATDETPATRPHPVTALEALPTGKITKLAAGGTILAALTEGQDLYAWGQPPRTEPFRAPFAQSPSHPVSVPKSVSVLGHENGNGNENDSISVSGSGSGGKGETEARFLTTLTSDPNPVDINNWQDIADVAIGERHLLALTVEGQIFAIGDNINGQLGLPDVKQSTDVWTRVNIDISEGAVLTGVVAGPRNSFVIVRSNTNTK